MLVLSSSSFSSKPGCSHTEHQSRHDNDYRQAGTWFLCPFKLKLNFQSKQTYLKNCFLNPLLNPGKGNCSVIGSDQLENSPSAGAGDRLSLSMCYGHWKEMGCYQKGGRCMEELDIKWATTSVCHRPEGKFIKAFMCIGPLYASHLDLRTAL